ncbi:MAG: hypothetical protein U0975_14870 [Erythrobacter sp.]|nr:hypothetical protein [Erythrobacter sp.]
MNISISVGCRPESVIGDRQIERLVPPKTAIPQLGSRDTTPRMNADGSIADRQQTKLIYRNLAIVSKTRPKPIGPYIITTSRMISGEEFK